ncbi:MAG TPA: aldehyde dehydrogenase [Bacteroidales bacterium]|nr:aldehyde dehydrogenase [Bacteroidales bacterium]
MTNSTQQDVQTKLKGHRRFFATHKTKELDFRIENLRKLKSAVLKYEAEISNALWKDLRKSPEEAYLTEISIVLGEIDYHLKNLRRWAKPKRVSMPLKLFPSAGKIHYEPLGVVLIIAPWNYPMHLLLNPLVGAISAGCCAMLKPAPYSTNTAKVLEKLITETFPEEYISVIQGGREANEIVLKERFDLIFFTGSPALGKVVIKTASIHLTPVVLELGGKSPCIVDKDADLTVAARRIMWGKTINAGQTCVAPDYLFVHTAVKDKLVKKMKSALLEMFGENSKESEFYPRIINDKAMKRLVGLMEKGQILHGGKVDLEDKFIEPTLIDSLNLNDPIMQEEIFGPILPIFTFENIDEPINYINSNEKPLALYYFGSKKSAKNVLYKTSSGGGCINDTLLHIGNHKMPFSGVGNSGMGRYHGYHSFLAFSHQRSIVSSKNSFDLKPKYAPFKGLKKLKRFL